MAIDGLQIWKDELAALPPVDAAAAGAAQFATWTADRVDGKLSLVNVDPDVFVFNKAVFETALLAMTPTDDKNAAADVFATAVESAMLASVMTIPAGAAMSPPPPPSNGTFSAPVVAVLNAGGLASAKADFIDGLVSAMGEIEALESGDPAPDSKFPEVFRNFFLSLGYDIDGTDTTSSSSGGPYPITAVNDPVE